MISGQHEEAVQFIIDSPGQVLRSERTLDILAALPENQKEVLQKYINKVRKLGMLNKSECLWLIKSAKKLPSFNSVISKLLEVILLYFIYFSVYKMRGLKIKGLAREEALSA